MEAVAAAHRFTDQSRVDFNHSPKVMLQSFSKYAWYRLFDRLRTGGLGLAAFIAAIPASVTEQLK